jgi:hypothetical protein
MNENQAKPQENIDKSIKTDRLTLRNIEVENAVAHGVFYDSLISTLINPSVADFDVKQQHIASLVTALPERLQDKYQGEIGRLQQQLIKYHDFFSEGTGHEKDYFIWSLKRNKIPINEDLLKESQFIEPYWGIYLAVVDWRFFSVDSAHRSNKPRGVTYSTNEPNSPSLMIVPNPDTQDWFESMSVNLKGIDKHEAFHAVQKAFIGAEIMAPAQEQSPKLNTAFINVRNELCAYLLSPGKFLQADAKFLCYSEDPYILKLTEETRDYLGHCQQIAEAYGLNPRALLLPIMGSSNLMILLKNSPNS